MVGLTALLVDLIPKIIVEKFRLELMKLSIKTEQIMGEF